MAFRTNSPLISLASFALGATIVACGPGNTTTDAATDTPVGNDVQNNTDATDVTPQDTGSGGDAGGSDAGGGTLAFVAHFDPSMGQFPEGVTVANGRRYVSFAPSHVVGTLDDTFTVQPFGTVPPPAPPPDAGASYLSFMLDLEVDAAGNVYAPVATFGGTEPATGVYRIPAAGGMGTLFSQTTTRPMYFPNGTDLIGTTLYVADSSGAIFTIDTATGATAVWSTDAQLAGDMTACGGNGAGFSVGVNNIDHDASNLYVTVSDFGGLLRIPINTDGSAGTPVVIARDCSIAGDDGLARASNGDYILAIGRGKIARVTPAGVITMLYTGAPLDFPTDVWFDTVAGQPALLITNGAYFTMTNPQVGILSLSPTP